MDREQADCPSALPVELMSQKLNLKENSQAPYIKMKHSNTPLPPCACNDL